MWSDSWLVIVNKLEEKKKLLFLEGIRGIAALVVVFAHFAQVFYPQVFKNDPAISHFSYESIIATTPINLLVNGNFAVCVFFVLSGYVLSFKFFSTKDPTVLSKAATKRYLRLGIPVLSVHLLAFALLALDAYSYSQLQKLTLATIPDFYSEPISIFKTFYQGAIESFFNFKTYTLNPVVWTMQYELYGSYIVFALLALFGRSTFRYIIYIVTSLIFIKTYYLAFILGVFLCDAYVQKWHEIKRRFYVVGIVILGIGLLLGSFPYYLVDNSFYKHLMIFGKQFSFSDYFIFYHVVGAFMLIVGTLLVRSLQDFFSSKIMLYLGKISFAVYLIHFLLINSLGARSFLSLSSYMEYHYAFWTTFIITMASILGLSHLIQKFIDELAIVLSNRFARKVLS